MCLARQRAERDARLALRCVAGGRSGDDLRVAVADVGLVVLGGGLGSNGDLLLEPVRSLLREWLPYPPRVEVSSLGDAAVLTGALSWVAGQRSTVSS